ncbi:MAG: hypoxanthine phosphoribosyltransferase [Bacteroidia bacterium]
MDNRIKIKDRHFEIYIPSEKILERVKFIAKEIAKEYADKNPFFIGILNGSFMFASDLLKELDFECQVSFIKLSSYKGTQSTGEMSNLIGLKENIEGRHVIIIEDIIDTGLTISHLLRELKLKNVVSLKIASLLLKKDALKIDVSPDFVGFAVPVKFLVGYGLDYDGYGRNFRHIYSEVL